MNEASPQPIIREQTEPVADRAPVPVWWLIALVLIAFWGMGYLESRGGGFNPLIQEPYPSLAFVSSLKPRSADDDRFERGRRLYSEKGCVACHMPNGVGNPSGNIPPLAGSDWVNAEGPNRIIRIVLHGFAGPVEVSGKQFNGAIMTPFGGPGLLDNDEDLAALLTYVRSNKEWGNNSGPATAAQVKAVRAATKDRNSNWTASELKAIPVKD